MSDRAKFFQSLSFLCQVGAVYSLRYILAESESCECHPDECMNRDRELCVVLDRNGIVFSIAPHIADRLGFSPSQMCGRNFYELLPERMRCRQWPIHCQVVSTKKPVAFTEDGMRGHRYDALFMPILYCNRVHAILGFASEERQFIEVLPDGTRCSL